MKKTSTSLTESANLKIKVLFAKMIKSLDISMKSYSSEKTNDYNKVKKSISSFLVGIPDKYSSQLAQDYHDYRRGDKSKNDVMNDWVKTMKPFEKNKNESVNEARQTYSKPNSKAKKQLKGMLKLPAKQFHQLNNFIYYDKVKKQWWFVTVSGELAEVRNTYYLKQINDYILKNQINLNESSTKISKFDNVRSISKNKAGIVFKIQGNDVVLKTVSGLIKTTIDDLELMPNESVNEAKTGREVARKLDVKYGLPKSITDKVKKLKIVTAADLQRILPKSELKAGDIKMILHEPYSNESVNEDYNSREERDAVEFYTMGKIGPLLHKKFKGKFHLNLFNKVLEDIIKKVSSPTNDSRLKSVIKLWSRNLGLDFKKYIGGEIIEDIKFIDDAQIQARKYYEIFTSYTNESINESFHEADGTPIGVDSNHNPIAEAGSEPDVISQMRDIVKNQQYKNMKDPKTGKKVKMDLYSASAIVQVYDAISDKNKIKFTSVRLPQMVSMAFKMIK